MRFSRLIGVFSYRFVYEGGRWRFVPDPANMREYKTLSVKQIAAKIRAAGGCAPRS